ncbi:MAG: hypothetical protein LBH00_11260 [Planctomycetaceae bacterium]|nr:hypothetical protein [Planctomycetaceae bacterium]
MPFPFLRVPFLPDNRCVFVQHSVQYAGNGLYAVIFAVVSALLPVFLAESCAEEPLVIPDRAAIVVSEVPPINRTISPKSLTEKLTRIAESSAAETKPLRSTCLSLLDEINKFTAAFDKQDFREAASVIQRIEQLSQKWDVLCKTWTISVSVDEDDKPCVPSKTALKEISSSIQRRTVLWNTFLKADAAEPQPVSLLYGKTTEDLLRLQDKTLAVERLFLSGRRSIDRFAGSDWEKYLGMRLWLEELKACKLRIQNGQVFRTGRKSPAVVLPQEVLNSLCRLANMTMMRLESSLLNEEQAAFLNNPLAAAWKDELQKWQADLVEPVKVLQAAERYEETGGMSDMRSLYRTTELLTYSKTPEYQNFAACVRRQYGSSNFKVSVSSALLNNHMPQIAPETARIRDIIQDRAVVGSRRSDTELMVTFLPNDKKIVFAIDAGLNLTTMSRTDASATQIFNAGQAIVIARKPVELTKDGFVFEPCMAKVIDYQLRLVGVDTRFDGLPLLSSLFRGAVINQYESKYSEAKSETQQKITKQVRSRIDKEMEYRFQPINQKIRTFRKNAAEGFDLSFEPQETKTEENWLLTGWGIRSKDALGSGTTAPDTLPGSFADVKIHESLFNMLVGKLEFEGKRGKVKEFKEILAAKFHQPLLAEPSENDDVEITFAPYNPLVIRFADGHIEITVSIAELRLLRQTYRDFQVVVRYKPALDADNQLVLERDGYISLINVRKQIVMRAVFGKVFPLNRPFPLVPDVMKTQPQYTYLTVGQCRIENGWFAAAVIEKESSPNAQKSGTEKTERQTSRHPAGNGLLSAIFGEQGIKNAQKDNAEKTEKR